MELRESDRLSTRLLALDIRLHELNSELARAQIRVRQLEATFEDARLASLLGESAGSVAELGPELERSRQELEAQRELVASVTETRWKARVQHALVRSRERRESVVAAAGDGAGDLAG